MHAMPSSSTVVFQERFDRECTARLISDIQRFRGNSDAVDNEYETKWSVTGHLV